MSGTDDTFDYIVVGAGSAGCVLASRLSEDTATTVLLLEAGQDGRSPLIRMPAAMHLALKRFAWEFESGPEPALNGRSIAQPRGRGFGGCSAVNGMVFNRGHPLDFDDWATRGLPEWSWAHCLPYFRRLESYDRGSNHWRGADGPMHVTTCDAEHPFYRNFLEAGNQAGFPITEDQNGRQQEGMHVAQSTTFRGERWSSADAYLWPAIGRRNLTARTDTRVHRVLLNGKRVIGVEVSHRGSVRTYHCNREVILAAGAIGSPHILLLSGIGDSAHLREKGLHVAHELPGVGKDLQDHPGGTVQYQSTSRHGFASRLTGLGQVRLALEWLLTKKGPGASIIFEVGGFIRTRSGLRSPNIQFEFAPFIYDPTELASRKRLTVTDGFQYFFYAMKPTSKGRISLRSANPLEAPQIISNFLQTPEDRQDMADGFRCTREIVSQPAWNEARGPEITPGAGVRSDPEILRWLRATVGTVYHPACSCRMGVDDQAVVDAHASVHGLEGLRVIDASIMPRMITANLNAAVIMMAEKLSDVVRGRVPLPPSDPRSLLSQRSQA